MTEPTPEPESTQDDTDLTDQDVNAVASGDDPDELAGSAEVDDDGLEHDPSNPQAEEDQA